jgi:NADP-dependent 3-hydroxy acid dehydrogenase YdfG
MNTIAIVGAGKGLGAAVARRFGREGFAVALLARDQDRVDALASELEADGVTAQGFTADVRDRPSLTAALDAAAQLGPIEVLQYSPVPHRDFLRPVLETTPEQLVGAVEFSILGPIAAVHQVLPDMRLLGRGTILFVNGGSAVRPNAGYAGTSIAFAGESAFAQMLHDTVAADGVHVCQLIIPGAISVGDPTNDPSTIADTLWAIHRERQGFRHFTKPIDA